MKSGAENGDPVMAFDYGALLRRDGKLDEAERYLRLAAAKDIPGARFELAELLKEGKTAGGIAEAGRPIDSLWDCGYRTYAGRSIDLLGVHSQAE